MRLDQLALDFDEGSAQTLHADLARNDTEDVRQDVNAHVDVFDGADHSRDEIAIAGRDGDDDVVDDVVVEQVG